jgi:spore germination cell wall hydrolase CwlJ-like protein
MIGKSSKLLFLALFLILFTSKISSETKIEFITSHTKHELECMAQALHHEARGEKHIGAVAVANVILNRVNHKNFPGTICGVVKQKANNVCQFTWYCDTSKRTVRKLDPISYDIAYRAVVLNQFKDVTGGALYFHNKSVERWNKLKLTKQIGNHIFYK